MLTIEYWVLTSKCGIIIGVGKPALFNCCKDWFRQDASIDAKSRGKLLLTWYLYIKISLHRLPISLNGEK